VNGFGSEEARYPQQATCFKKNETIKYHINNSSYKSDNQIIRCRQLSTKQGKKWTVKDVARIAPESQGSRLPDEGERKLFEIEL